MIIKGKDSTPKKTSNKDKSSNKKKNVIKKEEAILDVEKAENTNTEQVIISQKKLDENVLKEENFEKIDISSIDFKERIERRRGDRRRGYRRIDERSLVSRAQQEAHSIKELAAREGYQNGLSLAQKEIDSIKDSILEFLSMRDDMYREFYPHIMEMSIEIAKKIIKKEVEISNDVLKNIIISVMDKINSDTQKVIIKVNPQDLDFAEASLPEILEKENTSAKISFMSDELIEKGSCMIVANNGVIDANFKTQLSIVQNAFGIYRGGV